MDARVTGPGAAPSPALEDAVGAAALVGATRTRTHSETATPDRWSGLLTGGSFILVLGAWLVLAPPPGASLVAFLACVLAHTIAASVEFEIGPGSALPTTPVLVVSLFLLPPPLVPAVAACGLVLAASIARLRDPERHERLFVLIGSAWHAVGPAAVFALAGVTVPRLDQLWIYAAAVGAQLGCDLAASWVRNCWGLGVPTRRLLEALRFTFAVDLLLAPAGLVAVLAVPGSPAALLFLVPPTLLLVLLQRDRARHIDRTVVLGEAVSEAASQARRDVLTGLANRLAWEEALVRQRASSRPCGVLVADLDGLKPANDTFGHDVGDQLLAGFASLLRAAAPEGRDVVVARLGGDEFGVLVPGAGGATVAAMEQAVRSTLLAAPPVAGLVTLSASLGTGLAAAGTGLDAAIEEADRGVYVDKRRDGVVRRAKGQAAAT